MQRRFQQVDVFTARPCAGNPVAVVLEADGLSDAEMAQIARWTNLSETTFVLPPTAPEADYRLRIFSPGGELPFAGHPTVGSAYAVLECGLVAEKPHLIQECLAGLLPISVAGSGSEREISVQVPEATVRADQAPSADELAKVLGSDGLVGPPLAIDVGPVWVIAQVSDRETLRLLAPDQLALTRMSRELNVTGVTVFSVEAESASQVQVRSFAPAVGVPEDPVCGSGNACVAAYLAQTQLLAQIGAGYTASQGTELGRDGYVQVRVDGDGRRIGIGGRCVTIVEGSLTF
jgi:PhzF family phenazine biosynthesis protein